MIEEVGTVSAIEHIEGKQVVWVTTQVKSSCGKCEAQANCGTSTIAKAFANKPEELRFELEDTVRIGQEVSLGIPEESLLKASFLMYLLPLFALIGSVLVGQYLLPILGLEKEVWLICFAALSSFLTFRFVQRFLSCSDQNSFYPKILQVLPHKPLDINIKQL